MPYLSPLADEKASDTASVLLERIRQTLGEVPNQYRTMAHAPETLNAVLRLGAATHKHLPAKLREMVYLMVSMLNQCEYCISYHERSARRHGVTQDQLDHLDKYWLSDLFSDLEKACLKFADELTRDIRVDAHLVNRLKADLTEPQLVELAMTIGMANMINRFNIAFDIELP